MGSSRLGAKGPSKATRPGPPPPCGLRAAAENARGLWAPGPRHLTPAPFATRTAHGHTYARGPPAARSQRPSPLGVLRTLLPERRRHSLTGERDYAPGKKRSFDWPNRVHKCTSRGAWPSSPVAPPARKELPPEGWFPERGKPPGARETGVLESCYVAFARAGCRTGPAKPL